MQLTEIKKGHTGTGLLIENDGYVSLDYKDNKVIKESLDATNGDLNQLPRPFIVSAVFQKYGIENANGRIYPENVLRREVEKYQQAIKERRAYGECYTPDVMILCKDGWKNISDVTDSDEVLTLNTETNEIEIQKITKKIEFDFDGNLIEIKGRNIDEKVTPNHGYPIYSRSGNFKDFYTAEQILKKEVKDQKHSFIPKQGKWVEKGDKYMIIPGIKDPSKRTLINHPDCKEDLVIPMNTFMKFMGIYLSEGDFRKTNNDVNIYQVKENVCELIKELMIELGLQYSINVSKRGRFTFRICDPRLHSYISQLGDCYTKFIPTYLKQQSKEDLRTLYDWFVLGDGRIRGDKRGRNKNLTDDVFSASKRLILDFNEIQLKIGYSGNYHMEDRKYDRIIEGREIKGENCVDIHFSLRSLTKGVYLDERFLNVNEVPYKGKVMCIEVPNHTFYVMSNGKCHWSKNCNHPAESAIDLGRLAMNIVELHWENSTLIGKIEIPVTEGFRKYGIISCFADTVAHWLISGLKIGVSSRGLGSVKQQYGRLIVDDDYEIVCWDVVSQPSTPGAWIGKTDDEIRPYVESKKSDKEVIKEGTKYDKFINWLD